MNWLVVLQILRNTKRRVAYDLARDVTTARPFDPDFQPRWTPQGGNDHFDEWLRRWMKENGYASLRRLHAYCAHLLAALRLVIEAGLAQLDRRKCGDGRAGLSELLIMLPRQQPGRRN